MADPDTLAPAEEIITRALALSGLSALALPAGDPLLAGSFAVLDRDLAHIWYDASLPPSTRRFSLAHELAHWRLHDSQGPCGELDIDPDPQENRLPFGEAAVQGYSPGQRRETEANVFAAELLAPGPALKQAFLSGLTPREIAERVGIAESTVLGQLAESLLIDPPPVSPSMGDIPSSSLDRLDESQRTAAEVEAGPTLVVAGPGTGKTRTLIARIEFLLHRGTPPQQILALTFSNRAANEMRERLAEAAPEASRKVWIGTFHSFGLEILRRFGSRIGLPAVPRLLDSLDGVTLMERHLVEMELDEYEFLHDPMLPMRDLLGAISRAKDELKGPDVCAELAARMAEAADDESAQLESRRAVETARVYGRWQAILEREGVLDFGDLLFKSVELLKNHPDVRDQLRQEYPQILVDEYQDINRASAVLVREIAGDGRGLWLVGDLRQAIYRFRGASPANVGAFEQDYPSGRRVTLGVNYRSQAPLVELFSAAASAIGQPAGEGWSALRGAASASLVFGEADDEWAQADHIAAYIDSFLPLGARYRDQAVLCRTNRQAEMLGALLEERGVPVVFLGDLLARPEVKDLLALLSVASEGASAFRRIAGFEEYRIPEAEVERIVTESAVRGILPALSASADPGAQRLHAHLAPIAYVGEASQFFTRYLFGPSSYLRRLMQDDSVRNRQKRVALHQLLLLARGFRPAAGGEEHPHRAFLSYIRRLLATGEDARAAVPAAFSEIDGVRLMTIHAAKGLEFPVVFLPNLVEGMFPPRSRGNMVRLPAGLADAAGTEAEEEARLFFVALSRARDHLLISFPRKTRGRPSRPSSLLSLVRRPLEAAGARIERWTTGKPDVTDSSPASAASATPAMEEPLSLGEVETYLRCPRQFYYRYRESAPEPERDRAYRLFTEAVRRMVAWHRAERAAGRYPTQQELTARLEEIWTGAGLEQQRHAALLRRRLLAIRDQLYHVESDEADEWTAQLSSGAIKLRADGTMEQGGATIIERHHLGRESENHRTAPVLSLLRVAAEQRGTPNLKVVNRYLCTGEAVESRPNARYEPARIQKYERALQGILACRFEAAPAEPNECNRCPFFLVCPH